MNVDETQKKKIAEWISEGLKLSEIQSRIASELGLRMTYMEVRLLVDDLKLTPRDPEVAKVPPAPLPAVNPSPAAGAAPSGKVPPAGAGTVSVTVDQIARPGAMVSGKVTFSDGNKADWYLDQTGRLGLVPEQAGYRPPAGDVQQFQIALERELSQTGF